MLKWISIYARITEVIATLEIKMSTKNIRRERESDKRIRIHGPSYTG